MITAFQQNAFQDNAFQIADLLPGAHEVVMGGGLGDGVTLMGGFM